GVRVGGSPRSQEGGYRLGSVYVRKVHFRDEGMIRQIEEKVVNRLRQVTSAIRQDGANQVSIITSTADRQAAIEFAKAAALRPSIVGAALQRITRDPEVACARGGGCGVVGVRRPAGGGGGQGGGAAARGGKGRGPPPHPPARRPVPPPQGSCRKFEKVPRPPIGRLTISR